MVNLKQYLGNKYIYYAIEKVFSGWIGVYAGKYGLKGLILPERSKEYVLGQIVRKTGPEFQLIQNLTYFNTVLKKIRYYFDGKPVDFQDQEIDFSGYTSFQKKVLMVTKEIPYGKTRTYKWLAKQSGYPSAYRAVGGVMKINPVPLIIPCHRIIGSNGKLTGFSATGGLPLKYNMLKIEGAV